MPNFNTDFYEPPSGQTLSNIGSTSASLAIGYFMKNIPYPDCVPRMELVLEALLYAAGGEGAGDSVGDIIHEITSNEEKIRNRQNAEGFDSQSQFGIYVNQAQSKLSSDAGVDQRADAVVMCVALGLAIRTQDLRSIYDIYSLFSRALIYLAHAHSKSFMMEYGDMESLTKLDFTAVSKEINSYTEEFGEEVPMTSFAFEDLTDVFIGKKDNHVDINAMKDSELQSYKVEAEIIYSDVQWKGDSFCEDVSVPVRNVNGKITGYRNIGPISYPCIDESYNIAPVTGTVMNRTTVAVPPVSGTYDGEAISLIEERLRANYPPGAHYGDRYDFYSAEEFKHGDDTWLATYSLNSTISHGVSHSSHFEAYNYVNDHETTAGGPWQNGYRYGGCYDHGNVYIGYPGMTIHHEKSCLWSPNQCADHTATGKYDEDNNWVTAEEMCAQYNGWWNNFNSATKKCGFSNSSDCSNAGGTTWSGNSWVYGDDHYEIDAPLAFPNGPQRDMSLRHHVIREGEGSSSWLEDLSIIERTGFTIVPLEFSLARLSGLYRNYKVNPIVDFANVGRRAFAGDAPTVGVVSNTVGPPQPGFRTFDTSWGNDNKGGPFAHAQVVPENKTLGQVASITITPGWMWKFQYAQPTAQPITYHTMETGGWNLPLDNTYYHGGFSDPMEGEMDIGFESKEISNFYDKVYITGNEIHPPIFHTDQSIRASGREGRHNQDLTVNRFFGMGDQSQDYDIIPQTRLNAGFQWTFYTISTGSVPLGLLTGYINGWTTETFASALALSGAEWLYGSTTLGVTGPEYWNEFITGYIYTGDDSSAGAIVSCMHEYTGYSTTTDNTVNYWWVDPNLPSSPPFPHSGYDNGFYTSMYLAPRPNISKCRQYFPYTTTTTPEPTTTTTVTTTTCDPSDPNCDPGGSASSTTTTTSEDPLYQSCNNPIKVQCPYDCDNMQEGEEIEFCNYEQCAYADCDGEAWDQGIFPEDWDWVPLYGKQRGENPPRYWRGPFASTHYKFMYPNASGAFEQFYEAELQDPEFETLISGFPTKIKFDVHIEEYISKDICSGGYVDADGSIVLNEIIKNEEGLNQPSHQKVHKDIPWSGLVDANYSPVSESAEMDVDYGSYIIIHDNTDTRNNNIYDQIPEFCAGNKIGSNDSGIKYLPSENTASYLSFGGYYRYSGYDFNIEATYAKPSFSLESYSLDFSSIIDALSVGNELAYYCDFYKDNLGDPGNNVGVDDLSTFDPVYFLEMVSDSALTGSYAEGFLSSGDGSSTITTGYLMHPNRIYGDHWMGLRSGCLFNVTGDHDWQETGSFDSPCDPEMMEGYERMEACDNAAKELGMTSAEVYSQFSSDKVFLFNIGDNEIDIHFRRPAYLDGWEINNGFEGDTYTILLDNGCPAQSKANSISLTGLAPVSTSCSDGLSLTEELCCTNNQGSWAGGNCVGGTATWNPDGSAAPPWKKLNLFKQDGVGTDLTITKEIIRNEGLLFEVPTGEWSCSGSFYETITEHGARIAQGVRPTGCTSAIEWYSSTTTTSAGSTTTTEQFVPSEFLKVSGWREISELKITLKNFQPYVEKADEMPNDSWFIFQESGSCRVTGHMSYEKQEEACIYSEGIVLEDRSDDPWFHLIDYPHYASDVLKRDSFTLPSGDLTEHPLWSAPSRMITRWNIDKIEGSTETGDHMIRVKSSDPENYNKYLWPTISDLFHYNAGALSWESIPPEDGYTYHNSYLLISADAGQPVDVTLEADKVFKRYVITQHWGIYDSVIVNPLINPQFKIKLTKEKGGSIGEKIEPKGGYIVPHGTTCWDIKQGLVSGEKQGEEGYVESEDD